MTGELDGAIKMAKVDLKVRGIPWLEDPLNCILRFDAIDILREGEVQLLLLPRTFAL
jgi:hypothetical protein